jgi:hypothetical protein
MEKITSLNYGQIILYGYLCTSMESRLPAFQPLSQTTLSEIIDLIIELTDEDNYTYHTECPDVQIMMNPEKSFEIFCDFWDENEEYFVSL